MKNLELILNREDLRQKLGILPSDTAEDIRNKLELLEGEERLDKSAVKGLEEIDYWINKWKKGFWGNGLGGTSGGDSALKWHPNKVTVETGENLVIPSEYQLIFDEELTINGGDVNNNGDLYIDNYIPDQTVTVESSLIVTTDTVLTATNGFYFRGVDCTGGNVTITLPPVAGNTAMFAIKKIDNTANTVIVQGTGGDTVEGNPTQTLTSQWDLVTYVPNTTGWFSGL